MAESFAPYSTQINSCFAISSALASIPAFCHSRKSMIVSTFQPASLPPANSFQPLIFRISILLVSAGILHAEDPISEATKNPMSLLPDGSVLHGVLLPRYDKDRNLVGDLKAKAMTLFNDKGINKIQGEDVLIKFYKPDRSLRGKVHLKKAIFDQTTSQLRADEPVEITTDNLFAKGNGLIYSFQNGQGFLIGPSTTCLSYPETSTQTSMRPSTNQTAALLALCFSPSLAVCLPPANVSETELSAIKTAAASSKPELDSQTEVVESNLTADITAAQKASESAHRFAKSADIKNITTETKEEGAPLEVAPTPNDTIIKCDGGMYFDAEAGVLVYLKNVTVTDPRFTLTGADELKVFFAKKDPKKITPSDKKNEQKKESSSSEPNKAEGEKKETVKKPETIGPAANFGDVQKLIASGTVRLVQKGVAGKDPVEASGGLLTYDVPKGEIIISQRYPWVKQGSFYARAKQPNLTLRLLNSGSFTTQGEWEMGGNLKLNGR
jgi:hypothetical protein